MGKLRIFLQFAIVCLSISISACDDETGQNGGSADEILLTIENETFTISQAPSPTTPINRLRYCQWRTSTHRLILMIFSYSTTK